MNFLASEIPSSDSEDGDYEPPAGAASGTKPGALTLHKKKTSFVADDEWEEDDESDEDDDDDDDLEFDEDDVAEQARLLKQFEDMKRGAGPSSAAGPAAASSSAAGASSSGAGPSSSGAGAASSSAAAASSSAPPGPSAIPAAPVAPSSAAASLASATPAASVPVSASASAPLPSTESAPAEAPTEPAPPPAAESEGAPSAAAPTAAVSDADEIRPVKKPRVEGEASAEPAPQEPPESKKPASTIDDIWAEMNASTKKAPPKPQAAATDPGLMGWLSQPAQKPVAARPFKVKLLGELEAEAKARNVQEAATSVDKASAPRATGLEAALSIVRGPKKDGVLTKTKEVWSDFKGKDEEVEDELEKYKKDKNRYTDKVAFLERSDVRQWEYEQESKRRRR